MSSWRNPEPPQPGWWCGERWGCPEATQWRAATVAATRGPIRYVKLWHMRSFCPAAIYCNGEGVAIKDRSFFFLSWMWKKFPSSLALLPDLAELINDCLHWQHNLCLSWKQFVRACWFGFSIMCPGQQVAGSLPQTCTPSFCGASAWPCYVHGDLLLPFAQLEGFPVLTC